MTSRKTLLTEIRECWQLPAATALLSMACVSIPSTSFAGGQNLECDVAIIGAGPGGMHTAYKFATQSNNKGINRKKVCVFEKENEVGGRIRDKIVGSGAAGYGGLIATAAQRMYTPMYTKFLMTELNVPTATQYDPFSRFVSLTKPNNNPSYPGNWYSYGYDGFSVPFNTTYTSEDAVFEKLMCGGQVPKTKITSGPDAGTWKPNYEGVAGIKNMNALDYANSVLAPNEVQYLLDMYRFRGDFQSNYDASNYMDYIANDYGTYTNQEYAVPGFSRLIKNMSNVFLDKASDNAAPGPNAGKLYTGQPVKSITKRSDGYYDVETKSYDVKAKYVVIAVDANSLKYMTDKSGDNCAPDSKDIVERIITQPEYRYIQSAGAFTLTNQWDTKWWLTAPLYTGPNLLASSTTSVPPAVPLRRPESKIKTPNGFFISHGELGWSPYQNDENVTRTIYQDDVNQVVKWNQLYQQGGEAAVNAEMIKAYNKSLPNVFTSTNLNDYKPGANNNLPKIVKTAVTYVEHAWYGLKKGALKAGVNSDSIFEWATNPLQGERVYLVGDAYYPSYGWSTSAYMTSGNMLNKRFGMNINFHPFYRITCSKKGNGIVVYPTTEAGPLTPHYPPAP